MTRDEAIMIWRTNDDIDGFVALGMLKLDEPKRAPNTAEQKGLAQFEAFMFQDEAMELLNRLTKAGLKLVEK